MGSEMCIRDSTKTKTIFPHCTKIKNFFIVVLIPKPFLKFPDKLIGKGCPTTRVLSMWNEMERIASLHLDETLRPTALPHDSALHLYITCMLLLSVRLAPVVTVAAGTRWGDATPCYASLTAVAMCVCVFSKTMYLDRQRYTVFWPYTVCRPNTKTKISRTSTQTHTQTVSFFSWM